MWDMGIHQVTSRRRTAAPSREPYRGAMDEPTSTSRQGAHDGPSLADRFRAAGIPVPPPLTPEQEADLERRQRDADRQPRVYGPKHRAA